MKIDLSLQGEQVTAAVVTMVLAACADLDVSDKEVARVKEIVVKRTSWTSDEVADALIETAHDRIRDISKLSDDKDKLLAALTHIGTQIGDLAVSKAKRTFDIKDSGNIIPGHGGALDRFDGVLSAAIAIALLSLAVDGRSPLLWL